MTHKEEEEIDKMFKETLEEHHKIIIYNHVVRHELLIIIIL